MKAYSTTLFLALFLLVTAMSAPSANAFTYGSNITIYDGEEGTGYKGTGVGREDNEAEMGMVQSQAWDLEGFFRSGNMLTMIGGYNFKTGVSGYPTFTSGDIFISTTGTYGSPLGSANLNDGFNNVNNTYGYEYALKIDWTTLAYKAYRLNPATTTTTVYYNANETGGATSNPWKYVGGGTQIGAGTGTGGGLISTSIANEYGLTGMNGNNNHYAVSFDISSIFADADQYGKGFYTHFTQGCGNDDLIGYDTAPVPEPSTLLLFGAGLLGAGLIRRRIRK